MKKFLLLVFIVAIAGTAAYASPIGQRIDSVARDAWLLTAVRARLVSVDPDSATYVRVSVSHGVVTLAGQAKSLGERAAYMAAARNIAGVARVESELGVNPAIHGVSEEAKDEALAVRVSAAIASEAGANVFHVSPSTRDGIVTLRGTAPSLAVARTIVAATRHVSGVRGVVDDLTIRR